MAQFDQEIMIAERQMKLFSKLVQTEKWQGVTTDKSMATYEVQDYRFASIMSTMDLNYYVDVIKPNVPWADNHFEKDRVCGEPLNPGETWRQWPYGHSAARFLDADGQFNHSYAERYFPKFAGMTDKGELSGTMYSIEDYADAGMAAHKGIRGGYGDLKDVIELLAREPHTRQAYLPVFFPEDTGAVNGGRLPCSLGYQFLLRDNKLNMTYFIRSCDIVRHFRDDIYLTVRLLIYVLHECRKLNTFFDNVQPGTFVMHITSFHMFVNDYHAKWGKHPRDGQTL